MSRVIYSTYLFCLLIIPATRLFLASPWAFPFEGGLLSLLFILALIHFRSRRESVRVSPGLLPLFLLGAFMLFQLLPLPPFFLKLISGKSWELYSGTVWITSPGEWMPLSTFPRDTGAEFCRFSIYVVLYLLTVHILTDRDRVKSAASFFALSVVACSFFAVLGNFFSKSHLIPEGGGVGALFHLPSTEAILAMTVTALPVFLGLFLAARPRIKYGTIRDRIGNFLARPTANHHLVFSVVSILISAFIFLSFSRGANLCALLSTLILGALLVAHGQKKSGFTVFLFTAFFLAGALIAPMASHPFLKPGASLNSSLAYLGNRFLHGTGFGASPEGTPSRFLAGEILGGVFLGWFILSCLTGSVASWLERRNTTALHLFPAALAGLGSLLAGFALLPGAFSPGGEVSSFFFLAGLAVSCAHTSSRHEETSEGKTAARGGVRVGPAIWTPLLIAAIVLNTGIFFGRIQALGLDGLENKASAQIENLQEKALTAARWAPFEPYYPFFAGRCRLALKDLDGAREYFLQALRLNPSNGKYLEEVGLLFDRLGERETAGRFLKAGVRYGRFNSGRYQRFVSWLLAKGEISEALKQTKTALALAPEDTPAYLGLFAPYGIPKEKLEQVLPQKSLAYLGFGDYLLGLGQKTEGEKCYTTALYLAGRESPPEREVFQRIYRHYLGQNRIDDALSVVMSGTKSLPDDIELRTQAASLYERLGITYKAAEEYRRILLTDPSNPQATERLKELTSGQ